MNAATTQAQEAAPKFEGKPTVVHLKDYKPSPFLADHVKLDINLNEVDSGKTDNEGKPVKHVLATITNETTFRGNPDEKAEWSRELVLDGGTRNDEKGNKVHCLNFKELWLNGKPHYDYVIDYESGKLIIKNLPDSDAPFTIKTVVETNASENKEYSGLYESKGLVSTQCESEGFRNMTYALDRPDVISTYDVTIEADKERFPLLLANPGADYVEQTEDLGNGRHRARWNDPRPKPCYLFAMAALQGDVIRDTFTYPDGDRVELINVTDKGQGENARFAQACLKKAMQHEWDEWGHKYHGLHPDPANPGKKKGTFITLAVSAFNMGAMENNGFNIFNDKLLLASPENATDGRYFSIDSVVNHEYCHDETGNWRVPANWFQIAYKEGLTVFRDQTYTADLYDETFQRISDAQELRSGVFSLDDSPNTHPMVLPSYEGVSNNYDQLTYPKAAQVNQMLQAFVGKEAYRKAYREFHDNPHPEVCDVPTYLQFIGDHASMSVTFEGDEEYHLIDEFVDSWTNQSGVPTLKCDWTYDKERHVLKLDVEQILPKTATEPFVLPLKMGLVNPETGKDYFLVAPDGSRYPSDVLTIRDFKQSFEFAIVPEKDKETGEEKEPVEPIVSLNRDFTAYAKIAYADRVKPTFAQLAKQAEIDPNFFNRWDALQQIGIDVLKTQLAGGTPDISALVGAYRSALANPDIKPLLKAELLRLPDGSTVSNLLPKGTLDPVALRDARDAVRDAIAKELREEFKATYEAMQTDAPFDHDGNEMGRRALMNLSLAYLCAGKSAEGTALAKAQFDKQDNYNDIAVSWALLMDSGNKQLAAEAVQKIADVYQLADKDEQDHLVLGDWLGRQAMAEGATPDDIKALLCLPQIDKDNPNQIRSILGGAIGNTKLFHNPDGSGYRFIADQIIEVDSKNKETSSRLASGAFGAILKYTPAIQDRMAEAIGYIQSTKGSKLSPDCREVLGKLMASYEQAKADRPERNIVHEGTLGGGQGIQIA